MRGLEKNKQSFWYALYERSEPILDEGGNEIGEKPIYGNPIKESGNISEAIGSTEKAGFPAAVPGNGEHQCGIYQGD